ncbi:hypothetical protein KFL_002820100 [Klebsormidium nitens]|uniref:ribonuclease Z n=1 Tax=Klebsormidium nitens TaxID=105231 RepID=A0A1Y1I5T5_KLENI|nr:hypothetical protein KFL_002820100 [Klebsormidium nitens]|eukprot:GAQ86315.1 hypothetical protein KFL_002820100 [Klebsormidium nitens]
MEGYEVLVLAAEGDGVGPSLLLSPIPPLKGPQYLFNCPEGFARLAIEYKVRPSGQLAAVFLTSLLPQAAAGLPGLFLRLAVDGHEKLETCGPPGTAAYVHAQRHIVHWVHPRVTVNQASSGGVPKPIFQDGRLSVLPIFEGTGEVSCPCCLEGEASGGVGEGAEAAQKVAGEKKEPARMDLSSSSSESDSEEEDGRSGEKEGNFDGGGVSQVQPQGVCEDQALVGTPLEAVGEETDDGECAALLWTRPSSSLGGIPLGAVLGEPVEASEGGANGQRDVDQTLGAEGGPDAEGGEQKDEVLENKGKVLELAEGSKRCESEAKPEAPAGKSPLTVDLSTSFSVASENGSEGESESEAEAKSLLSARKKIMLGLPPKPTRGTGRKPEKSALFAELDSIFMGGAKNGKTVRQQALSTLTAGPPEKVETVLGGADGRRKQELGEGAKRIRRKRRKGEDGRKGERMEGKLERGSEENEKEGKPVGVPPFKRRKKVVEITSSGGEAFSVEESFEVEVTPLKTNAGLTSHAGCAGDVCVQSKGGEGARESECAEHRAVVRRGTNRESGERTTKTERDVFGSRDGMGSKNEKSPGRKGDEGGEASEESSESEEDGECLKQLLSPPGSKRRGAGKGRGIGEAKEALFAHLDDIFNSEGSASKARNRALETLGRPAFVGALGKGNGGAGSFGAQRQKVTEKRGSKGGETGLGGSKKSGRDGEETNGAGLAAGVGLESVQGEGAGGSLEKQSAPENGIGKMQATAIPEPEVETPSSGHGAASPSGGLRLRGGGPRNFQRGGPQQGWGSINGGREGGLQGGGVPGGGFAGGGFTGAPPFMGGRNGGGFGQHPGLFGGGGSARGGSEVPLWKKRFRQQPESNSEDSDTWQEEARESGMHWLLQSASVRRTRKLRKGLPAGGPGVIPGGGVAAAGGAPPRPKPRVQIDSHTPSTNPVYVRTKAGVLPMEEGLGVLKQTVPAGGGSLLGYLCFFGPPVNGSVLMVDCRDENACAQLKTIRLPACVRAQRGAHRLMAVFHFTPADVAAREPYKEWVRSFGGHVRHVMLSDGGLDLGYRATYGTLARLNLVDKGIFPLTGNATGKSSASLERPSNEGDVPEGPQSDIRNEHQGVPETYDEGKSAKKSGAGNDAKGRGFEPGGVGLLARVNLRGLRPGSDAPAEVDESRCLPGVNVEGIQAQVLRDQPALAFWKEGGRIEDFEAEKGGGAEKVGEAEGRGGNGGTGAKAGGAGGAERETGKGGAEAVRIGSGNVEGERDGKDDGKADEQGDGKDAKIARTQEVRGAPEGAANEKTNVDARNSKDGVTGDEKAAKHGEGVANQGGHVAAFRPSGIGRNATQAELMYERQLAEQAAVLAQQWHYLTPTINKAHCGLAKPQPNPTPETVTGPGSEPSPEANGKTVPKTDPNAENQTAQKQDGGASEGLRFRGAVPQVLFLGTGSAEPSKYRGGSAILLTLTPGNALLMDCGEGAAGQLFRTGGLVPSEGPETERPLARAQQVARSVRVLWVSHKHADHCLGVVGVLNMRGGGDPRLLIVGPVAVQKWLEEVGAAMQENGHTLPPYIFRHCRELGSIIDNVNQPRVPSNPPIQPLNPGLSPAPPFSAPQHRQRPSFGQPPRASRFVPQYHPETFLAGPQQRLVQGAHQQYSQQLEEPRFQQQMYTQPPRFSGHFGGIPQHAYVQQAPSMVQSFQPRPFDHQTQFFAQNTPQHLPFQSGPFAFNQHLVNYLPQPFGSHHPSSNLVNLPRLVNPTNPLNPANPVNPPNPPNTMNLVNPVNPSPASQAIAPLNLVRAQAVPVHHCADSWGLVIHHADGWSLVYSGDTRPTRPLIEAGRGCTLLIHEATFEGKLLDHARRKRHSTTEEALDVAAQMGARRTILTHFSQRYPKAVEFESNLPAADSTCIAFDGMAVPFSELARLPSLLQPIRLALADVEKAEERDGA